MVLSKVCVLLISRGKYTLTQLFTGGGLFALGLIHANHGTAITDYLLNHLKDAQSEATRHGGCLGLGLAAMGTNRQDVYEQVL